MTKVIIPESKVDAVKQDAMLIIKESQGVSVTSLEQCVQAAHFFTKVVSRERRIEEIYDTFVKPFEVALKEAKAKMKMMSEPYEQVAEKMRGAMNAFLQGYYEEENKLAEQSKEPIERTEFSVRTENGLVYVTERLDYDIEDMSKVPAEYLVTTVDPKKIKEAMANGEEVAGIRFYRKPVIATRA